MSATSLPPGIILDLLTGPDRNPGPDQRAICSLHGDEPPAERQAWAPWEVDCLSLHRRGVDHGQWLVIDPRDLPADPPPPLEAHLEQRWFEAQPIVLRNWAAQGSLQESAEWFTQLSEPKGLRAFLSSRLERLGHTFAPGSNMHLNDAERDRERIRLGADGDLWIKNSRLSSHASDASLRVRHAFGKEGPDDLSRDIQRHRLIQEAAQVLWPALGALPKDDVWSERMEAWIGGPVLRTQPIAYFNAPDGGALWHHDAFDEPVEGCQRGVLFVQSTGRTAWLACSLDALTHLTTEWIEYLAEGELPWIRKAIPDPEWARMSKIAERFIRLRKELAKPGQGILGRWIGQPEFTALAADAGHAYLLEPGDALLLPNHGLESTAMHSVFCADSYAGLGYSMALREDRETEASRQGVGGARRRRRSRRARRR